MSVLLCKDCHEPMSSIGCRSTMVGYGSNCPLGLEHDDNCQKHTMVCKNGHIREVALRRTCVCGWRGKLTCSCHEGEKLEFNPNPLTDKTQV